METIKLNEICGYLPYGLKVKTRHGIAELTQITSNGKYKYWITYIKYNQKYLDCLGLAGRGYSQSEIKPL